MRQIVLTFPEQTRLYVSSWVWSRFTGTGTLSFNSHAQRTVHSHLSPSPAACVGRRLVPFCSCFPS